MRSRALVIIPAYNEAETISRVIAELQQAAPEIDRLVITDGSRDATPSVVSELGERHLELACNIGYGRALQVGIHYALANGYEVVVFLDGDGQHDARDVPRLIDALEQTGADVVIGSRYCQERRYVGPLGRRFGQFVFSRVTQLLLRQRIYDTTSGFKAMRASACEAVVRGLFADFHTETLVRLSMLGFTITEVPITVREREFGYSMHSLGSAIEYPVKTFLLTAIGIVDALSQRRAQ
jgi:glycosyltransferase involved in cell wall biosynthesis